MVQMSSQIKKEMHEGEVLGRVPSIGASVPGELGCATFFGT